MAHQLSLRPRLDVCPYSHPLCATVLHFCPSTHALVLLSFGPLSPLVKDTSPLLPSFGGFLFPGLLPPSLPPALGLCPPPPTRKMTFDVAWRKRTWDVSYRLPNAIDNQTLAHKRLHSGFIGLTFGDHTLFLFLRYRIR